MAQPAKKMRNPIFVLCLIALAASTCLAVALDWAVLQHRILESAAGIPADLESFRRNAEFATRSLSNVSGKIDFLPYPPPFLLLSVPMSWLPPKVEFFAWTFAGAALLVYSARLLRLPWLAIGLGLLTQPTLYCMTMGQTGMFVSAGLILSLGLAETQPVIAGIAAGCLIIKPQFGLLLPVCFLASRNWRAMAAAAATVFGLCALPAMLFGFSVWHTFLNHDVATDHSLMAPAWPQGYQYTMVTVFMLLRSLGAGMNLASFVQIVASLGAAGACWWLWRRGANFDRLARLAATLCLVICATPYAYIYDLPALAVALAGCATKPHWRSIIPITILGVFTSIYVFFSAMWFLPGAIVLVSILLLVWPENFVVPALRHGSTVTPASGKAR